MSYRRLFNGLLFIVAFLGLAVEASAKPEVVLPATTFERGNGSPVFQFLEFETSDTNKVFMLKVYNGGANPQDGNKGYARSAVLFINDQKVVSKKFFRKNNGFLSEEISLKPQNKIKIKLFGKPGSKVTLEIISEEPEPPQPAEVIMPLKTFESSRGFPQWQKHRFSAPLSSNTFTLNLYNGKDSDSQNECHYFAHFFQRWLVGNPCDWLAGGNAPDNNTNDKVSFAQVVLNGKPIIGLHDFYSANRGLFGSADFITKELRLKTKNTLHVKVFGRPGSKIAIEIVGESNGDFELPKIEYVVSPERNESGWHNVDVEVSFNCSDAESGIARCSDTVVLSQEGQGIPVEGIAVDNAGNQASVSLNVSIDKTAPSLQAVFSPAANNNYWHRQVVNVSFACQDVLSGISRCPAAAEHSEEGAGQVFSVSALDKADNKSSESYTLNIDLQPPTISASFSSAANTAGWFNQALSIAYVCDDALSGIALCPPLQTISSEGASQVVQVKAIDIAGHETLNIQTINLDMTAPVINVLSPSSGSSIKDATPAIDFSVSDNLTIDPSSLRVLVNGADMRGQCTSRPGGFTCVPQVDLPQGGVNVEISIRDLAENSAAQQHQFVIESDQDGDGVPDNEDLFPTDPNEWSDLDQDGIGDNSDIDRDGDGISNDYESQLGFDPNNSASTPPDLDGDAIPDALDDDRDSDGVLNSEDAFPDDPSESSDLDADGIGDNADQDRDGDGVDNENDAFPNNPSETADLDGDGIGDNSDNDKDGDGVVNEQDAFPSDQSESADLDGDGIGNNSDTDRDGDGVNNNADAFPNDPKETSDLDGDGLGDNTDTDRDGDGVNNGEDAFPNDANESADSDGDGVGDNADSDRDGDGVVNEDDAFPSDPSESEDLDGDGIGNNSDPDIDGDGVLNEEDGFPLDPNSSSDRDGDGIPDNLDHDIDGDGVNNEDDAFPGDPTESADLDGDGVGDNADSDRDGDGIDNSQDAFPNDASESADLDGDGIGDNADSDRDGDGVENAQDAFPNDATETADLDGDGIGDNADTDRDGDGVVNAQDVFPNDPSRSLLPSVVGLALEVTGSQVQIRWQPPQTTAPIVGYRVLKSEYSSSNFTQLTQLPSQELSFTDSNVENGKAYAYQVAALAQNGSAGLMGTAASVFIAFNNYEVTGLQAQRNVDVELQWTAVPDVSAYRIFRNIISEPPSSLAESNTTTYVDNSAEPQLPYEYRVASLLRFLNPISNQEELIQGPLSASVSVDPVNTMSALINSAEEVSSNAFLVSASGDRVSISGRYLNNQGPVDISFQLGSTTLNISSADGNFRLSLPVLSNADEWTVRLQDTVASFNKTQLVLRVVKDTSGPTINLSTVTSETNADVIVIRGAVTDAQGDIADVYVTSSRFDGTRFEAIRGNNFQFSSDIPLLSGLNIITVNAADDAGNLSQAMVEITRTIGQAPVLEVITPQSGTRTESASINLSGVLYTSLSPNQLKIVLGQQEFFPQTGSQQGVYPFSFNNIPLNAGYNNLEVFAQTPAGTAMQTVIVRRITDEDQAQNDTVEITLFSPSVNTFTKQDAVNLSGVIRGSQAPINLQVNGSNVAVSSTVSNEVSFQYSADISQLEGETQFELLATDASGASGNKTLTVTRDTQLPALQITSPNLLPPPEINTVTELPFTIAGSVQDQNFAALTINGQNISLDPGGQQGDFTFNTALNLPMGTDQLLRFDARDMAGNTLSQEYLVNAVLASGIEVILPRNGSSLQLGGVDPMVEVLARLSQAVSDISAYVQIDQNTPVQADIIDSAINIELPVDHTEERHQLKIWLENSSGDIVASTSSSFDVVNLDNIPFDVQSLVPSNAQNNIEPNATIAVTFNRSIDPALLEIDVRETVNGLTYIVERSESPEFFPTVDNAAPVQVNRSQESVAGDFGVLPGSTVAVFQPQRIFAYGAEVYINISYDGESVRRSTFKVREIPTFLQGMVQDQNGLPISGLTVSLPRAGLETVTNSRGSFTFGFALPPEKSLESGQYEIVYNPGGKAARFAELSRFVQLERGHLNRDGSAIVPELNLNLPRRSVRSGQPLASLANGELEFNFSQAELQFSSQRNSGSVHVQFIEAKALNYAGLKSAQPQWMFMINPADIEVSGTVGVRIQPPRLRGTHNYIPEQDFYVVMIGFNPVTKVFMPVGVGLFSNRELSATLTELRSLNYIGYAFSDIDQKILKQYADGELSLQALIAELERDL